ncbi:MAG: hypothetical protein IPM48_01950 [Saprospiraceae bacterium]|nr:hypothetical protein [Saprospiraceae bacterium]
MGDPLKKFIQEHKNLLDHKTPPADLFDKILAKTSSVKQKPAPVNRNFSRFYLAVAVFAGVGLFYCWSLFYTAPIIHSPAQELSTSQEIPATITPEESISESKELSLEEKELIPSKPSDNIQIKKSSLKKLKYTNKSTPVPQKIEAIQMAETQIEVHEQLDQKEAVSEIAEVDLQIQEKTIKDVLSEQTIPTQSAENEWAVTENIVESASPQIAQAVPSSLSETVKKGLLGWLAKKTEEWTDRKILILPEVTDEKTSIAFNVNTEHVKLRKTMYLP